jgi:hypothetical protein
MMRERFDRDDHIHPTAQYSGSTPLSGDQGIHYTRLITPFQPHWAKTRMR